MNKLAIFGAFGAAVAFLSCTPALAEGAATTPPPPPVTGNIALVTDYAFRGISQTNEHAAVQGGFDATIGQGYVGAWGSSIGFGGNLELDLYAGWKPTVGPVALDFGVIGYFYPGAKDKGAELDYFEPYIKGSITPAKGLTLGASAFYSPEFTGKTSSAYYLEGNGAYSFNDQWAISGAYGYQDIDDVNGPAVGKTSDSYSTWNVGGTYSNWGLAFDLRYVGTSIGKSDPIAKAGFVDPKLADDRIIFSIKKSM